MTWKGHRAAISLTFDDGLPVQIQHALPVLNVWDIPSTFFLIVNSPYDTEFRTSDWQAAIKHGHEIGSHGMNHKKAAELNNLSAQQEVSESKKFLEYKLGVAIDSFCYPYTDAPPNVQNPVRQIYKQARGGRVARKDKIIERGTKINLHNVPCVHVNDGAFEDNVVFTWIDACLERRGWLSFMFHGVGPDPTQWDNVNPDNFIAFVKYLKQAQDNRGLWLAPFGAVAEEYRKC